MSAETTSGSEKDSVLIFRASKTDPRTGETIYAKDYGLRGFPILVPKASS